MLTMGTESHPVNKFYFRLTRSELQSATDNSTAAASVEKPGDFVAVDVMVD